MHAEKNYLLQLTDTCAKENCVWQQFMNLWRLLVRTCAVKSGYGVMLVKLKAGKLFADVKFSSDKSSCKKFRQIIIPHVCKTIKVTGDIALLNVIVLSYSVHVDNVNKTLTFFPNLHCT